MTRLTEMVKFMLPRRLLYKNITSSRDLSMQQNMMSPNEKHHVTQSKTPLGIEVNTNNTTAIDP